MSYYANASGGGFNQSNAAYGGGGGFVSSPFQPQHQNRDFDAGAESSQAGKGKGNVTVTPTTIRRLLEDAFQAHPDTPYRLDDKEVHYVSVVARLRSITPSSSNVIYHMEDGTGGAIEARKWLTTAEETRQESDLHVELKEQMYVKVLGTLKATSNVRYIFAVDIRPVTNMNEITAAMLEAVYVHLYNTRGPVNRPHQIPSGMHASTTMQSSAYNAYNPHQQSVSHAGGAGVDHSHYSSLSDQQQQVLKTIRSLPQDDNGVFIDEVHRHVSGLHKGEVRAAIDALIGGGELYHTSGDDWIKSTSLKD